MGDAGAGFIDDDLSLSSFHTAAAAANSQATNKPRVPLSRRWASHTSSHAFEPRAECGYVGLQNQGATCYLNSLLQTMFMTPELRKGLYKIEPAEMGANADELKSEFIGELVLPEPDETEAQTANRAPSPAGSVDSNKAQAGDNRYQQDVTAADMPASELQTVAASIPEAVLDNLMGMGFTERQATAAWRAHPDDAEAQVEYIFNNPTAGEGPEGDRAPTRDVEMTEAGTGKPIRYGGTAKPPAQTFAPPRPSVPFNPNRNISDTVRDEDMDDLFEMLSGATIAEGPFPEEAAAAPTKEAPKEAPKEGNATATAAPAESPAGSSTANTATPAGGAAPAAPARDPNAPKRKEIAIQLQKLFGELHLRDIKSISTEDLTKRGFAWQSREAQEQHDVQELNRILMDAVESQLRGSSGEKLIRELYEGTLVNQIICKRCGAVSERSEPFLDLVVPVKDANDLMDGLQRMTAFELLEKDNQYLCGPCDMKVDAQRGAVLRSLPPVLIISQSRFEYDYNAEKRIKINTRFPFPLVLDMAPYCEGREQAPLSATTKTESTPVEAAVPVADPVEMTAVSAGKAEAIGPPPPLDINSLTGLEEGLEQPNINLNSPHLYELFSVVIHSGGAYGGHYHAYIHDYLAKEKDTPEPSAVSTNPAVVLARSMGASNTRNWFDFNDTSVTEIPVTQLAREYGGRSECGYMLVYRRRETVPLLSSVAIEPPSFLRDAVDAKNAMTAAGRAEQVERSHKIEITFHSSAHYYMFSGALTPLEERRGEAPVGEVNVLLIDKRWTVGEMKKAVKEAFAEYVPDPQDMVLHLTGIRLQKLRLTRIVAKDDMLVAETGLEDGAVVIAWDAQMVGEDVWEGNEECISVQVMKYDDRGASTLITVRAQEHMNMADCKGLLSERTGIAVNEMYCCKIDYFGVRALKDEEAIVALELVGGGARISCERFTPAGSLTHSQCAANKEYLRRQQMFDLVIVDTLTNKMPYPQFSLLVERDLTVAKLKRMIYDMLAPEVQASTPFENTRLRRSIQWGGSTGQVFTNENLLLTPAGVMDQTKITIEEGPPPILGVVNIRFVLGVGESRLTNVFTLSCSIDDTVSAVKQRMAAVVEKDPSNLRMRKVDAWDNPSKLVNDESVTLPKAQIKENDILWLEEGKAPVRGQMSIGVDLYVPAEFTAPVVVTTTTTTTTTSTAATATTTSTTTSTAAPAAAGPSDPLGADRVNAETAAETAAAAAAAGVPIGKAVLASPVYRSDSTEGNFTEVGKYEVSCFISLQEFKLQLCQSPLLESLASDISRLRVWDVKNRERLLRDDSKTLKEHHIDQDQDIVLQILPEAEQLEDEQMLLYLHKRNPLTRTFAAPIETKFFAGPTPKANDLREHCAIVMDIPIADLTIARYNMFNGSWMMITEESLDEDGGAAILDGTLSDNIEFNVNRRAGLEGTGNLRQRPYLLKDGDIIAIKDRREDPADDDHFFTKITGDAGGPMWSLFDNLDNEPRAAGPQVRQAEAQLRIPH